MTLLSVRGLTKRFGGLTAVSELSFDIERGQIVGIFGPNGSGKTTLLNLIAGLLEPTAGRLVWHDHDPAREIHHASTHERAAAGIVKTFQNPLLFSELTVHEHLMIASHLRMKRALGLRRVLGLFRRGAPERAFDAATAARVQTVLALCRLEPQREQLAASLSYGAEKMLGVAMSLMCDPQLLLLDEPASGLDQDEVNNLDAVLRDLRAHGTTLCIIDHKVSFLGQIADRAMAINHGCKLAEGTPAEVLKDRSVIEAYLGVGHVGAADVEGAHA